MLLACAVLYIHNSSVYCLVHCQGLFYYCFTTVLPTVLPTVLLVLVCNSVAHMIIHDVLSLLSLGYSVVQPVLGLKSTMDSTALRSYVSLGECQAFSCPISHSWHAHGMQMAGA